MKPKYRYQFPIAIALFRWGMTIEWIPPIVRIYPRSKSDAEDSIFIYINMSDEDF